MIGAVGNSGAFLPDEIEDYIADVAEETAHEVYISLIDGQINCYRVIERILYNYKRLEAVLQETERDFSTSPDPATNTFCRNKRKKSIRQQALEDKERDLFNDKLLSYERAAQNFHDAEKLVLPFINNKEFIVIRMYYWNEDAEGNERGADAEQYTWKVLAGILGKNEKTLRRWREKLIHEMMVMLFGDYLVSISVNVPEE